jgi:hypothetical protein
VRGECANGPREEGAATKRCEDVREEGGRESLDLKSDRDDTKLRSGWAVEMRLSSTRDIR